MPKVKKGLYFICPYCGVEYSRMGARNKHVLNSHRDRIEVKYDGDGKWVFGDDRNGKKLKTTISR